MRARREWGAYPWPQAMKPYFVDSPGQANRASPGGCNEEASELDLCVSLIRLVDSLEQLIACSNGAIFGSPPRLRLSAHCVLEFEERAGEEPDDEISLLIRRI